MIYSIQALVINTLKLYRHIFKIIFLLIAIASLILYLSSNKNSISKVDFTSFDDFPSTIITNMEIMRFNDQGYPKEVLASTQAHEYDNIDKTMLQSPVITLYENNNSTWIIKSQKAEIINSKQIIHLDGSVKIKNLFNSTYITSNDLIFDRINRHIQTKSKTILQQPNLTMTSDNVNGYLSEDKLILHSNVEGELKNAND